LDSDVILSKLVEQTNGFSGAEIEAVANRAAITALKRYVSAKSENVKSIKISQNDLEEAIELVKPKKQEKPMTHTQ